MRNKNVPETKKLGNLGEDIVARYLENKGFSIRCRNYAKPYGEIDIIAEKANTVHFVEVKTISREIFYPNGKGVSRETNGYSPEDNIHPWKVKRMVRTAQAYLVEQFGSTEIDWQCDAVAVYLDVSRRRSVLRMTEHIA